QYGEFADANGWSIDHKIELYEAAAFAFGSDGSEEQRLRRFAGIYGSLSTQWHVFRQSGGHWPIEQVFEVLSERCADCGRASPITLPGAAGKQERQKVEQCVRQLRDLKLLKSGGEPVMAVYKFLHFFNPRLFPIYDHAVVAGRVLYTFRREF